MRELPDHDGSILVRTCFSMPQAWAALQQALVTPNEDGFLPELDELDDQSWEHASPEDVVAAASEYRVVALADERALSEPDFPVLVLQRNGSTVHWVRAIATQMWSIENNVSLANMDFESFIEAAGEEGVYRGFN